MSEWININVKQPEHNQECLITNGEIIALASYIYKDSLDPFPIWKNEHHLFTEAFRQWMPAPSLPESIKEFEWIKLSEKKPLLGQLVLFCSNRFDKSFQYSKFGMFVGDDIFTSMMEPMNERYCFVTHWAFLPNPPA